MVTIKKCSDKTMEKPSLQVFNVYDNKKRNLFLNNLEKCIKKKTERLEKLAFQLSQKEKQIKNYEQKINKLSLQPSRKHSNVYKKNNKTAISSTNIDRQKCFDNKMNYHIQAGIEFTIPNYHELKDKFVMMCGGMDMIKEEALGFLENLTYLIVGLMRSNNFGDCLYAITGFVKCISGKPLINSIRFDNLITYCQHVIAKLSKLFPEIQDDKSSGVWGKIKSLDMYFDTMKDTKLFYLFHKMFMYIVSFSILEKLGFTMDFDWYKKTLKKCKKEDFGMGFDFWKTLLSTVIFIVDKVTMYAKTGEWLTFFHDSNSYTQAFLETKDLKVYAAQYMKGQKMDISDVDFTMRVEKLRDVLIEMRTVCLKFKKGNIKDVVALQMEVETMRDRILIDKFASQARIMPYTLLLYGNSSIGKTTFSNLLFYYIGKLFDWPTESEYFYTINFFDDYLSKYKTSKWAVRLDELASLKVSGGEVDPSLKCVLQYLNPVPVTPAMADIDLKGNVPMNIKLAIGTTNVKHLNSSLVFECPIALNRRFRYTITLQVRNCYRPSPDIDMLDSSKVPPLLEGQFPDYWNILVEKCIPANLANDKNYRVDSTYVQVNAFTDTSEQFEESGNNIYRFFSWLATDAKEYYKREDRVLDSLDSISRSPLCVHCKLPDFGCRCLIVKDASMSALQADGETTISSCDPIEPEFDVVDDNIIVDPNAMVHGDAECICMKCNKKFLLNDCYTVNSNLGIKLICHHCYNYEYTHTRHMCDTNFSLLFKNFHSLFTLSTFLPFLFKQFGILWCHYKILCRTKESEYKAALGFWQKLHYTFFMRISDILIVLGGVITEVFLNITGHWLGSLLYIFSFPMTILLWFIFGGFKSKFASVLTYTLLSFLSMCFNLQVFLPVLAAIFSIVSDISPTEFCWGFGLPNFLFDRIFNNIINFLYFRKMKRLGNFLRKYTDQPEWVKIAIKGLTLGSLGYGCVWLLRGVHDCNVITKTNNILSQLRSTANEFTSHSFLDKYWDTIIESAPSYRHVIVKMRALPNHIREKVEIDYCTFDSRNTLFDNIDKILENYKVEYDVESSCTHATTKWNDVEIDRLDCAICGMELMRHARFGKKAPIHELRDKEPVKMNYYAVPDRTTEAEFTRLSLSSKANPTQFLNKIKRNCVTLIAMRQENDQTICVRINGIFVKGQILLTPDHMWREGNYTKIKIIQSPMENMNITITNFDTSRLHRFPNEDLCMLKLSELPPFPTISELFVKSSYKGCFNGWYFGKKSCGNAREYKLINIQKSFAPFKDKIVSVFEAICPEYTTEQGDCGLVNVAETNFGIVILGFHQMRNSMENKVYTCIVDHDWLSVNLEKLFPFEVQKGPLIISAPGLKEGRKQPVLLTEQVNLHHFNFIEGGHYEILGEFEEKPNRLKSKVGPTMMQNVLINDFDYVLTHAAPDLKSYKPWNLNLQSSVQTVMTFGGIDVEIAFDEYMKPIREKIRNDGWLYFTLDTDQAINGLPGVKYIDAINRKSSMGWPYSSTTMNYARITPPFEEFIDPIIINEDIIQDIANLTTLAEEGFMLPLIVNESLKDEPRELAKVETGNTRLFDSNPKSFTILVRMKTMSVIKWMMENRNLTECMVGVVAQSKEWSTFVEDLSQHDISDLQRVIAGDFKKFDKTMGPRLMEFAFRVIIEIATEGKAPRKDIQSLHSIATTIIFCLVHYDGFLVRFFGGNPSGQSLTVILNSIYNSLLVRIMYLNLNPNRLCSNFREKVVLRVYGDDNIMTVVEGLEWFNHTTLAEKFLEFGMVYTMADKKSASVPYISLTQSNFLKRGFEWDEELSAWRAPLVEDSIKKMLMVCVQSPSVSRERQSIDILGTASREYFLYGREIFEEKRKFLKEISKLCSLDDYESNNTFPLYNELVNEFLIQSGNEIRINTRLNSRRTSAVSSSNTSTFSTPHASWRSSSVCTNEMRNRSWHSIKDMYRVCYSWYLNDGFIRDKDYMPIKPFNDSLGVFVLEELVLIQYYVCNAEFAVLSVRGDVALLRALLPEDVVKITCSFIDFEDICLDCGFGECKYAHRNNELINFVHKQCKFCERCISKNKIVCAFCECYFSCVIDPLFYCNRCTEKRALFYCSLVGYLCDECEEIMFEGKGSFSSNLVSYSC